MVQPRVQSGECQPSARIATRGDGYPRVPRPPPPSSPAATVVMKANRPSATRPEIAIRDALIALGYRDYLTNVRALPGRPDLAFLGARLAIFCNGCFWHRHGCPRTGAALPKSNSAYWAKKFELNRERDGRKEAELKAAGWDVLTLWECEILRNPRACALRVGKALRGRQRLLTDPKGEVPEGGMP